MSEALRIWHPFTQEALDPPPLRITRAEGVHLYTHDGRCLLDGISSWWVNLHGHCHLAIVSAISKQAARLDHVLLAGASHKAVEELCVGLGKVLPKGLRHIFFSDNGSTAVEVALKMAVQYWGNLGRPEKRAIVALEHAYHGDTVGAMSVSADSAFTAPFSFLRFPVYRVHSAYCYQCPVGKTRSSCKIDCVAEFGRLLEEKHGEIAAVIVEPLLQGAGGMIVHPIEFLVRIARLCREHDVLLIADEVLTGFGRCGKMFACELANVIPDLMCLSKGLTGGVLPMGATVCSDRIQDAFVSKDRTKTFFHGHSYSGNPLAAAAGAESLRIFEREPVFERIMRISTIHEERLRAIKDHPAVGEVRFIGTVAAIELRASDAGYLSELKPKLYEHFLNAGVLLRPLGNIIYVLPAYVISPEELHYIHDRIAEALDLCLEWSNPFGQEGA
jgi:adenosylmethionine-8-amino-7-oxononanoate aminotransferase